MKERLLEELQMVKARRQKTKSALDALYGLNIIDEEYRGLIPIHTIYGYFRTGRCTQLQGHEGAYNLYAIESRLDRIVVKLDVVISKLDEIRENQYDLFRAMTDTNNLLSRISRENHRMSQSLDTIKENSELIAFNVQANNDQIRAIANMMFFRELMRK